MKLEFEIKDIERDEVVDAIARSLLTQMVSESDETGDYSYIGRSKMAASLTRLVDKHIREAAEKLIREQFETTIKQRIEAAVDEVLANGWTLTDRYGNPNGGKTDLKGRLSEELTKKTSAGYGKPEFTRAEVIASGLIENTLRTEFSKEIEAARVQFRKQLDDGVAAKFAESVRSMLGVR